MYSLETIAEAIPAVFSHGNSKLGNSIYAWSLPASVTCPGKTELCERLCYALKYRFAGPANMRKMMHNWILATTPHFSWWMTRKIRKTKASVVRIHASGDFFSATYVRQWLDVAKALPHVQFYAYTRSWRVLTIRPILAELSQLDNFSMWYSIDAETGSVVLSPEERKVRTAYLAMSPIDTPSDADLVFRDYPARGVVQKHVRGSLVCPAENGTHRHITCEKCRICFSDPEKNPAKRTRGRWKEHVVAM